MTTGVNGEVRRRIKVAVAAYAYEFEDDPIMSDGDFNRLCQKICPEEDTGNPVLDLFFLMDFSPETGSWVHKHPDIAGLARVYREFFTNRIEDSLI